MKRLGKLNLVPCKKNLIRLQDLSLELYNIIKSDAELFKKEHTIPNVNITLNKQKMIFSKIDTYLMLQLQSQVNDCMNTCH